MALLEIDDLHVNYGSLAALRGASLFVQEGEIVCVCGPNGAGKSTTFQAIAGGVRPHRGSVCFKGESLVGKAPEAIARLGLSLVPEGRHVFATLSVDENLRIGTYQRWDTNRVRSDRERMLELFPRLRERLKQPAGKLSGGEQQMLVICRALMTRPQIILIDEPSLGLAPQIVGRVYDVLRDMRRRDGLTLLINEQSSERVMRVADRIYVLRSGAIQLCSRPDELTDDGAFRSAYFGFDKTPAQPKAVGR